MQEWLPRRSQQNKGQGYFNVSSSLEKLKSYRFLSWGCIFLVYYILLFGNVAGFKKKSSKVLFQHCLHNWRERELDLRDRRANFISISLCYLFCFVSRKEKVMDWIFPLTKERKNCPLNPVFSYRPSSSIQYISNNI